MAGPTLLIINMETGDEIKELSWIDSAFSHQMWLSEDHSLLFINDELDEICTGVDNNDYACDARRTIIVELDDLDSLSDENISYHEHESKQVDHNMYVRGSCIFSVKLY